MFFLKKIAKVILARGGSGSITYRVTIPKDIVTYLELNRGDHLQFVVKDGTEKVAYLTKVLDEK